MNNVLGIISFFIKIKCQVRKQYCVVYNMSCNLKYIYTAWEWRIDSKTIKLVFIFNLDTWEIMTVFKISWSSEMNDLLK